MPIPANREVVKISSKCRANSERKASKRQRYSPIFIEFIFFEEIFRYNNDPGWKKTDKTTKNNDKWSKYIFIYIQTVEKQIKIKMNPFLARRAFRSFGYTVVSVRDSISWFQADTRLLQLFVFLTLLYDNFNYIFYQIPSPPPRASFGLEYTQNKAFLRWSSPIFCSLVFSCLFVGLPLSILS